MKIYWQTLKEKYQPEPKGLPPIGSRVYKGFQGSGKTLSMVLYAKEYHREFPQALIFGNLPIDLDGYTYTKDIEKCCRVKNADKGVLILIDEAHLYFQKKGNLSIEMLGAISQQRKNRRKIIFTTQIWEELDISLRKQVKEIVNCQSFLRFFIRNTIYNGETLTYDKLQGEYVADKTRSEFFKKTKELCSMFDTKLEIVRNTEQIKDWGRGASPQSVPVLNIKLKN
ncbi:MAG: hypothetical protein LBT19_02555 [Candidatus Nomurabacteria bacterium]|jgi:hypothetical protein|nr:hypothetical protein [Candidatus Nomurabacteria bacterium]